MTDPKVQDAIVRSQWAKVRQKWEKRQGLARPARNRAGMAARRALSKNDILDYE